MKKNLHLSIVFIITICLFSTKIIAQGPKDPGGNPDDSSINMTLITEVELPQPLLANNSKELIKIDEDNSQMKLNFASKPFMGLFFKRIEMSKNEINSNNESNITGVIEKMIAR